MFSFEPDPPDHFEDAAKRIVLLQRASISDLEIALDISSAEAKRMMDALEAAGVVGPSRGNESREILIHYYSELDSIFCEKKRG